MSNKQVLAHGEVAILVIIIEKVCRQMYRTCTSPNFHCFYLRRERKSGKPISKFCAQKTKLDVY
jgi:hypothetical protein